MAETTKEATFLKQPPRIMGRDVVVPVSNPITTLMNSDYLKGQTKATTETSAEITNTLNNLLQSSIAMQNSIVAMQQEQSSTNKALHKEIIVLQQTLKEQLKDNKFTREEEKRRSEKLSYKLRQQLKGSTKSAFTNTNKLGKAIGENSKGFFEGLLDTLLPGLGRAGITKKLMGWVAGIGAVMLGLPKKILGFVSKLGKWIWELLKTNIGKLFKSGKGLLTGLFGKVGNFGKVLGASIGGAFKGFGKSIADFFKATRAVSVVGANGTAKGSLNFLGRLLGSLVGDEKALAMMAGISGVKTGGMLGKVGGFFGKLGTKGATKGLAKASGILGKKIPGLGLAVGAGLAASRFANKEWGLGTLELASGLAATIPGIGTAVSLGIDGIILAVDAFKDKFGRATDKISEIFSRIKQGWGSFADWFKEKFQGFKDWWESLPWNKGKSNTSNNNVGTKPEEKTWSEKHPVLSGIKDRVKDKITKQKTQVEVSKNNQFMSTSADKPTYMSTIADKPVGYKPEATTNTVKPALKGNANALKIWNYLREKGFSPEQTAGIMGNLQAESGLEFGRLQGDFTKNRKYSQAYTTGVDKGSTAFVKQNNIGYGLAQWTSASRKQGLLNEAKRRGVSISDPQLQLDYLYMEMQKSGIDKLLKKATSVREASNLMLTKFERPRDQGIGAQNTRAAMGNKILGKKGDVSVKVPVSEKIGETLDYAYTTSKSNVMDWLKGRVDQFEDNPILGSLVKGAINFMEGAASASEDFKVRYSNDTPDFWKEYRGVDTDHTLKQKETAFEMDEESKKLGLSPLGSTYGVRDKSAEKINATVQAVMPTVNTNQLMWWQFLIQQ